MSIKWVLPLDMNKRAKALSPRIRELEQELKELREQRYKLQAAYEHISAFTAYNIQPLKAVIRDWEIGNSDDMIVDMNPLVDLLGFHGYNNVPQIEPIESGNYRLTWEVVDNNVEFTFEEIENV